jgi:hypothetical protein
LQAFKESINDIGYRLAKANDLERELVGDYPIYNGAPGGGGGPPPPKSIVNDLKNTFGPGGSSESVVAGTLEILANWSGPDPIFVFLSDPLGGKLSTQNGQPSGFQTIVRSGGPAPGSASDTPNSASLFYGNGVALGSYGVGISIAGTPTGTTGYSIDVLFHPAGESEPSFINSFSGTLDSGAPGAGHGFGVSPNINN